MQFECKSGIQDLNLRPLGPQFRELHSDKHVYQLKHRVFKNQVFHKSHEILPFPLRKGKTKGEDVSRLVCNQTFDAGGFFIGPNFRAQFLTPLVQQRTRQTSTHQSLLRGSQPKRLCLPVQHSRINICFLRHLSQPRGRYRQQPRVRICEHLRFPN